MPLRIVRDDITKMDVDVIVNAANKTLLGGGGVDGAIHRRAGEELLKECKTLGGCKTGEAKITKGYNLSAKYIIHTVGPIWNGGTANEEALLTSCYEKSLKLAAEYNCKSIAFPLISSGAYGYPKDKALRVAVDTISKFLFECEIEAYIVVFDKDSFRISEKIFSDIASFIDDNYTEGYEEEKIRRVRFPSSSPKAKASLVAENKDRANPNELKQTLLSKPICDEELLCMECAISLEEAVSKIDESFSEMLLRKIDEKGISDVECYKKANIDRKLFSKIKSDRFYKPAKATVLAFAIALELPIEEAREMLQKAGFALSRSNKFDIIVEYFLVNKNYNIFEINEALFAFDQKLLGA